MYNNGPLIRVIADESVPLDPSRIRERARSSPCLPERLPNLAFLRREAEQSGPLAIIKQLRRSPSLTDEELIPRAVEEPSSPSSPSLSVKNALAAVTKRVKPRIQPPPTGWKPPQQFEIFRAVERKDIMFL